MGHFSLFVEKKTVTCAQDFAISQREESVGFFFFFLNTCFVDQTFQLKLFGQFSFQHALLPACSLWL